MYDNPYLKFDLPEDLKITEFAEPGAVLWEYISTMCHDAYELGWKHGQMDDRFE